MQNHLASETLLGVRYHLVDHKQLLSYIENCGLNQSKANIFNVNIHAMNLAQTLPELKQILNQGDMVFVDGYGVKLGAKFANKQISQRLTPMDWIDDLFRLSVKHRWKIFLLGDIDDALDKFAVTLQEKHPNCDLVGYHHGFFERQGSENETVIKKINASKATILLVGMSMPIQEQWIWHNKDRLEPCLRISTGAMHRVYTGDIDRAPKWVTDNGFEWFYRLCMEPKKTWKRYILGNPLFIFRVIKERIFN